MALDEIKIGGLGASRRRGEDNRFIRGKGNYVDDIALPGMLHMEILRSPLAHARIRSIDVSGAWAIPGGALISNESLQAAATRKLAEETGVRDLFLEQLYTFSDLDDFAPGGAVAVTYFALVRHEGVRLAERSAWAPGWFALNALPVLAVEASVRFSYAILLVASLGFLGLGVQPPSSDWGLMISESRIFIVAAPWVALAPGVAVASLVIGVNLLADGIRQARLLPVKGDEA